VGQTKHVVAESAGVLLAGQLSVVIDVSVSSQISKIVEPVRMSVLNPGIFKTYLIIQDLTH
jgi:hypothetical protein